MSIKFRIKIKDVEGIQYTGENTEEMIDFFRYQFKPAFKDKNETDIVHEKKSNLNFTIAIPGQELNFKVSDWMIKCREQIDGSDKYETTFSVFNNDMTKILFDESE